jgi:hypothetical protein
MQARGLFFQIRSRLSLAVDSLRESRRGASSIMFAMCFVPTMCAAGLAIDYAQISAARTRLQAAVDAAVLAGVLHPSGVRNAIALNTFEGQKPRSMAYNTTPGIGETPDGAFEATVTGTVSNQMMQLLGIPFTDITVRARAAFPRTDESCILSLGGGLVTGEDSMTFNGGSNLDLAGCTLQSNTSMVCNGNTTAADLSLAVGIAAKCTNAVSSTLPVPDIHAAIASHISRECGVSSWSNLVWTPASRPGFPKVVTVTYADRDEHHVCGSLTLSGAGTLAGVSTTRDTVIVVENGALVVDKNALISAPRTAFVMVGTAGARHDIDFPQGAGAAASLSVTPPLAESNPWRSVALYQDPSLTGNVDMSWGPGTSIYIDGLIYFPNANLTMSGSGNSNSSDCTKLVVRTLTSNGSFNFSQSDSGCETIGLRQHRVSARLLY